MTMMALRITEPSLCMNCVHSGHCVFERTSATPVMHCDEHSVPTAAIKMAAPAPQQRSFFVATGLCITCDHVKRCGLRSPDKIVLHCEHYE